MGRSRYRLCEKMWDSSISILHHHVCRTPALYYVGPQHCGSPLFDWLLERNLAKTRPGREKPKRERGPGGGWRTWRRGETAGINTQQHLLLHLTPRSRRERRRLSRTGAISRSGLRDRLPGTPGSFPWSNHLKIAAGPRHGIVRLLASRGAECSHQASGSRLPTVLAGWAWAWLRPNLRSTIQDPVTRAREGPVWSRTLHCRDHFMARQPGGPWRQASHQSLRRHLRPVPGVATGPWWW